MFKVCLEILSILDSTREFTTLRYEIVHEKHMEILEIFRNGVGDEEIENRVKLMLNASALRNLDLLRQNSDIIE